MKMVASGSRGLGGSGDSYECDSNKRATVEAALVRRRMAQTLHRTVVVGRSKKCAPGRFDRDHSGIEVDAPTTVIWDT